LASVAPPSTIKCYSWPRRHIKAILTPKHFFIILHRKNSYY